MIRRLGGLLAVALFALPLFPACSQTATVVDLYTALDADGARRRNVFFTDTKTLNCVAELGVSRDDVTFEMLVRQLQVYDFATNKDLDTNIVIANAEVHPGRSQGVTKQTLIYTALGPDGALASDLPLPKGRAQCEAYLDGNLERTAVFNIDFPPCPTSFIRPFTRCFGFYPEGHECNLAGATGDPKLGRCRCEKTGWKC